MPKAVQSKVFIAPVWLRSKALIGVIDPSLFGYTVRSVSLLKVDRFGYVATLYRRVKPEDKILAKYLSRAATVSQDVGKERLQVHWYSEQARRMFYEDATADLGVDPQAADFLPTAFLHSTVDALIADWCLQADYRVACKQFTPYRFSPERRENPLAKQRWKIYRRRDSEASRQELTDLLLLKGSKKMKNLEFLGDKIRPR